jgi:hypothetical protein
VGARQTAENVRADLAALNEQASTELAQLTAKFNAQDEVLAEIAVRPKSTDIHVPVIGLAWMPYSRDQQGRYRPAWTS